MTEEKLPIDLKLVGKAKMKVLWWSVYNSELYTETGKYQEAIRPLKLKLTYQRKIKSKALVKETRSQWNRMRLSQQEKDKWCKKLSEIWPNVKKKDSIIFYADADNISYFYFNDKFIGKIADANFTKYFSAIWLSEDSEYPELTKQLVGK